MLHKFTVLVELVYDDENGEYPPPTVSQIERGISAAFSASNFLREQGFEPRPNVEAAKGDAKKAFGIS